MEEIKIIKSNNSFTCDPSVIREAKDNAWRERKSLSEIIESLLIKWNKSKKKEKEAA